MTNVQHAENNHKKTAKLWALIPCGGSGSRAQTQLGDIPKQYRVIAGKPMVMHTLAAFEQVKRLTGGLVVIALVDDYFSGMLNEFQNFIFSIAPQAGNTRAKTVFNGLEALISNGATAADWVLVHDAARCLITPAQIDTLIDACLNDAGDDAVGGLLALPLPDTLKVEKSGEQTEKQSPRVATTLGRSDKWLAQTPQMFRIGALIDALSAAGDLSDASNVLITDESSAMERLGHAPKLVRGSAQNFKVTYPEDFALAEAVLQNRQHSG